MTGLVTGVRISTTIEKFASQQTFSTIDGRKHSERTMVQKLVHSTGDRHCCGSEEVERLLSEGNLRRIVVAHGGVDHGGSI